ncbi:MAG: hypothetical protein ABII12_13865 [Planctomycetota bacterium]
MTAVGETRYLLKRWRFTASDRGAIWVQPIGSTLSPEELAGLFALLAQSGDPTFPKVMLLDLAGVKIVGNQYTLLLALIKDFARSIHAACRIISARGQPLSAACFYRGRHI